MTPLILASVDAVRAGGGPEPGMGELVAGQGGSPPADSTWAGGPRPRRMVWPNLATACLVSRLGSYQVSPLHKAGPRAGVLKGLEAADVSANLSKTLCTLSPSHCVLQTI